MADLLFKERNSRFLKSLDEDVCKYNRESFAISLRKSRRINFQSKRRLPQKHIASTDPPACLIAAYPELSTWDAAEKLKVISKILSKGLFIEETLKYLENLVSQETSSEMLEIVLPILFEYLEKNHEFKFLAYNCIMISSFYIEQINWKLKTSHVEKLIHLIDFLEDKEELIITIANLLHDSEKSFELFQITIIGLTNFQGNEAENLEIAEVFNIMCSYIYPSIDYLLILQWILETFNKKKVGKIEVYLEIVEKIMKFKKFSSKAKREYLEFLFSNGFHQTVLQSLSLPSGLHSKFALKLIQIFITKKKEYFLSSKDLILQYCKKFVSSSNYKLKLNAFRIVFQLEKLSVFDYLSSDLIQIIISDCLSGQETTKLKSAKFLAEIVSLFPNVTSEFVRNGFFKTLALEFKQGFKRDYLTNILKICNECIEHCSENIDDFNFHGLYEIIFENIEFEQNSEEGYLFENIGELTGGFFENTSSVVNPGGKFEFS